MATPKAQLAQIINDVIQNREWTQDHAAKVLGILQSDMSNLHSVSLDSFSLYNLMEFLVKLGHRVTITVQDEQRKEPPKEILVLTDK